MKKYFVLFFTILAPFVFAKEIPQYGDIKVSKLISIQDGDTFKVDIDSYPPIIGKNISIRIANIDTPEIKSKDPEVRKKAYAAKDFIKNVLENGHVVFLKNIKRDKYFRILAEVEVDGKNLGTELINNKLALPYDGNKKTNWILVN